MIKENKELITVRTYLGDIEKSHQAVVRYLHAGEALPGIQEYYHLKPNIYILKKDHDYKSATARIRKQKFIFAEK